MILRMNYQMTTKVKELRAKVESGSISDVVLHFLYIYHKSAVYQSPTSQELYELNFSRYKKKDNLDRALSRLLKAKLVSFDIISGHKHYKITPLGIDCVYKLAMLRTRKEMHHKSIAGKIGTDIQYGYGLDD